MSLAEEPRRRDENVFVGRGGGGGGEGAVVGEGFGVYEIQGL